MANNIGTLVIAPVRPQSDLDTYPVAYANELRGGYYQVADFVELYAIPAIRRVEGLICWVSGVEKSYRLIGGIENSDWQEVVIDISSTGYTDQDAQEAIGLFVTSSGSFYFEYVPFGYLAGHVKLATSSGLEITSTGLFIQDLSITPGEYTKVVVNSRGQVTEGYLLSSSDLPAHLHDAQYSPLGHLHDSNYVKLSDYEDLDVLNKIKNVDGTGSGLDADLLDGHDSSFFSASTHDHDSTYVKLTDYEDSDVLNKIKNVDGPASGLNADLLDGFHVTSLSSTGHLHDATYVKLSDYEDQDVLNKIKNVDGSESGLDADLLDGKHYTEFSSTGHLHTQDTLVGIYKHVDTIVERNAIPSELRAEGMIVWVYETGQLYILVNTLENSGWQIVRQEHNLLTSIQGGTSGEYFHLTSTGYNNSHTPYTLGTKLINEALIGDGKLIAFNSSTGKLIYVTITSVDYATSSGNTATLEGHPASFFSSTGHLHDDRYLQNINSESIGDLNDVNTSGVANNKILKYNSTSGKWEIADDANTLYTAGDGLQLVGTTFSAKADGSTITISGAGIKVTDSTYAAYAHNHNLSNLADVNDSEKSDGKILAWNTSTGKHIYVSAGSGSGDMLKSTYDTNDDGIVNAADYATSSGNADTVDGYHASSFSSTGHTHSHTVLTDIGTFTHDQIDTHITSTGHLTSTQKTDLTDGGDTELHNHDGRYYTETESDLRYSSTGHTHTIDQLSDVDVSSVTEGKALVYNSGVWVPGNAGVENHNDLTDIQGGIPGEYFHLSSTGYNNSHSPYVIGTKTVSETTIADGFVLSYNSSSGNIVYTSTGSGSGISPWQSGVSYEIDNYVSYVDSDTSIVYIYKCIAAHTSSALFTDDYSTYWVPANYTIPAWSSGFPYLQYQVVAWIAEGPHYYMCGTSHISTGFPADLNSGYWVELFDADKYHTAANSDILYSSTGHLHDSRYVQLTDYEDLDVLNKVKNVDGASSGLDADLLDGKHGSEYSSTGHTHLNIHSPYVLGTKTLDETNIADGKAIIYDADTDKLIFSTVSSSTSTGTTSTGVEEFIFTTIVGLYDYSLDFTPISKNSILVLVNGQAAHPDYYSLSGNLLSFDPSVTDIYYWGTDDVVVKQIASHITQDLRTSTATVVYVLTSTGEYVESFEYVGTGTTGVNYYTMSFAANSVNDVLVYVDGEHIETSNYSINGSKITFDAGIITTGCSIVVRSLITRQNVYYTSTGHVALIDPAEYTVTIIAGMLNVNVYEIYLDFAPYSTESIIVSINGEVITPSYYTLDGELLSISTTVAAVNDIVHVKNITLSIGLTQVDIDGVGSPFSIYHDGENGHILCSTGDLYIDAINTSTGEITDGCIRSHGKIYNAVWNDYADFWDLKPGTRPLPGLCYSDYGEGLELPKKEGDSSIIGIYSNTFGQGMGDRKGAIPIAVAGFCLAYVDTTYKSGTLLTNAKDGKLKKASIFDILFKKVVAKYIKSEENEYFNRSVKVNGRCWVKIV